MKKQTNIEVNTLKEIFEPDFELSIYPVGHDFLVLTKKISMGNHLELSLWASNYGINEYRQATNLELLIGIRDEDGDIDIIEDEVIELSDIKAKDEKELLGQMLKEFSAVEF